MGSSDSISVQLNKYESFANRRLFILFLLVLAVLILVLINISTGSSDIQFSSTLAALFFESGDDNTRLIIQHIRLPMALMAIVVGAALAISGCEIQTILHNPIASPYTLGVSSAAAFGAAVGMVLDISFLPIPQTVIVTVCAFIFTLLTVFILYLISSSNKGGKNRIILLGVALNFLFHAMIMFMQYIADEQELKSLTFWTFGSLLKASWDKVAIVSLVLVFCYVALSRNAWQLTAITLDEHKAQSLGVNTKKVRRQTLLITSLLSAFAVCFVGTIGFIGLISPHIAREIVGEDQRFFLPASALVGALILSVSLVISKLVVPGVILPVGLITSLIGVPFFIAAVMKRSH